MKSQAFFSEKYKKVMIIKKKMLSAAVKISALRVNFDPEIW